MEAAFCALGARPAYVIACGAHSNDPLGARRLCKHAPRLVAGVVSAPEPVPPRPRSLVAHSQCGWAPQ